MRILGIETSCDETAAAIVENGTIVVSQALATSLALQQKWGGVVPEQAAREQLRSILPVIDETLKEINASPKEPNIDAVAVTYGPGLIGSLLVGVETAKTLSLIWNKPLVPVNHLLAHFYAAWLDNSPPLFPALGLLVSGGHTDLIHLTNHGVWTYLGGTRDDAAGEAFDKTARLLGFPYPGGAALANLAKSGRPGKIPVPSPMLETKHFEFSFSGLKTAVARICENYNPLAETFRADLAAGIQEAIVQVLVRKTVRAASQYKVHSVIIAGGVAANEYLRILLAQELKSLKPTPSLQIPKPSLCTDNAVMVAACAHYLYKPTPFSSIQADPSLSLKIS